MTNVIQQKKALDQKIAQLQKQSDHLCQVVEGNKPNAEQARKIKSQAYSFTVHFERREVLRKVRSPGKTCKSLRRFTSQKEAQHHGKRFTKIHNHVGFKVVKVAMRANAWVNWLTGKTNPVLNK